MGITLVLTCMGLSGLTGDADGKTEALPIVCSQIPASRSNATGDSLPDGSRLVRIDRSGADHRVADLTKGFATAGDPDVAFDAQHILFVGRRSSSDPSGVWEMNNDGSGSRQITVGPGQCRSAIYLSTIYTIDADAPFHQIAFLGREKAGEPWQVYTCKLDGTLTRQITFAPYGVRDPLLLSDGRLLVAVLAEPDPEDSIAGLRNASTLMTLHVDGSELFPFAGQHEPPQRRGMACETPDDHVVYVESQLDDAQRYSQLVAVKRTRSLHSRQVISTTSFTYPSPLPNGDLLVSGNILGHSGSTLGLMQIDSKTHKVTATVFDDPGWDEIHARAIYPRKEPEGRSSVIKRLKHKGELTTGYLYGLDAYLSNTPEAASIHPGAIRRLRVVELLGAGAVPVDANRNQTSGDPDTAATLRAYSQKVLGEAPVESDGSFFVEVPARVPLRLETLNEAGQPLQKMTSWIWVMPGERRGCIGCHEDRELTPPNRHVEALRRNPDTVGVPTHVRRSHGE